MKKGTKGKGQEKIVYKRTVDKAQIPTCNILGVNIAAINMEWLVEYLDKNLSDIKGDYICVSNVHTTVTSYEDASYCAVQNGGINGNSGWRSSCLLLAASVDIKTWRRTTGPSLIWEKFLKFLQKKGYRHYFYGCTEETLEMLEKKLEQRHYPGIQIAGMYSPPFRPTNPGRRR